MNSVSFTDSADYQLTIKAEHVEKVRNFSLRVQGIKYFKIYFFNF